jgi:hypothetical protein
VSSESRAHLARLIERWRAIRTAEPRQPQVTVEAHEGHCALALDGGRALHHQGHVAIEECATSRLMKKILRQAQDDPSTSSG